MKESLLVFLKGAAMGAANVIPGVSGGTVAFVTGIYERLINAVKSFGGPALGLLLRGRFREFAVQTDLAFLAPLGAGVVFAILTFAELLKYLFANHAVLVWAFFFGLILASVFYVGREVRRWSAGPVIALLLGAGIAVAVAMLKPASQNEQVWYLALCGVVAMASMIIPGISGSFVLLLMGNYQLIMIDSVSGLKSADPEAFRVLVPVAIGAILGMVALSHLLSWIFRRFHNVAVALLTGFVAGSLLLIWPWKEAITASFGSENLLKEKVVGYEWKLPPADGSTLLALGAIAAGVALVCLMERFGAAKPVKGG